MKLAPLFFLIILFPLNVNAAPKPPLKLAIFDWQETTELTKTGKKAKVLIQGKVQGAASNQFITSFSIGFDPKQNIKIGRAAADIKLADFTFVNNVFTVKFPKPKTNNEEVSIYFTYEENYPKIDQYLRQEMIYIPEFAAGANASVIINFSGEMESATLNPNITKNGNAFIYKNIVPKNGVHEIIKLTPSQSVWDVNIKAKISSNKALGKVAVTVPTYFQNSSQKMVNLVINTSPNPQSQNIQNGKKIYNFDTVSAEILIENKARIYTGKNFRTPSFRNPGDYLKYSAEDASLLIPILSQIKQDSSYGDLPLYAKIGKFVNQYIKYDEQFVGRLPKIKEILQNKIGVCTEYAKLYNGLARVAGIPAQIVNGGACGEYDKCQGHAWNIIYYNNQWIDVDPTWDLMSGIVSSSHIYSNDDGQGEIEAKYFQGNVLQSNVDFEMKKAL